MAMASQYIAVTSTETGDAFTRVRRARSPPARVSCIRPDQAGEGLQQMAQIMSTDIYEGVQVDTAAALDQLQQTVPIAHLRLQPAEYVERRVPCPVSVCSSVPRVAGRVLPSLPTRLPFSRTVPESLRQILAFVEAYYEFLVGFPSGFAEFDDLIRQAVDGVLVSHLNQRVVAVIDEGHRLNLSQAVQVLINVAYLEDAVPLLERHLSEARYGQAGPATTGPPASHAAEMS